MTNPRDLISLMGYLAGSGPDRDTGMITLTVRNRDKGKGRIDTPEELAACEAFMREPRLSNEVYHELKALVKAYKAKQV